MCIFLIKYSKKGKGVWWAWVYPLLLQVDTIKIEEMLKI